VYPLFVFANAITPRSTASSVRLKLQRLDRFPSSQFTIHDRQSFPLDVSELAQTFEEGLQTPHGTGRAWEPTP
jgi:hypothetical protein